LRKKLRRHQRPYGTKKNKTSSPWKIIFFWENNRGTLSTFVARGLHNNSKNGVIRHYNNSKGPSSLQQRQGNNNNNNSGNNKKLQSGWMEVFTEGWSLVIIGLWACGPGGFWFDSAVAARRFGQMRLLFC
jgi:hypothetical protein